MTLGTFETLGLQHTEILTNERFAGHIVHLYLP
jgi:hypothetical protein